MRILITGGAGFIGSQLGFRLFNEGHDVLLLDNMSYGHEDNLTIDGKTFGTFIKSDVRDKGDMMKYTKGVDCVFHFAGIAPLPDCQIDPYNAVDVNVSGTANVLEASRINGVKRVVFASTSAIYENNEKYPVSENDEVSPDLIYATTKKQCELLCRSFTNVYSLPIVILRFFNVYGPHQDFKRLHPPLIGYILKSFLQKEIPTLFSDGEQKRDYVYVDDLTEMCNIVMTHKDDVGEIFNVCSGDVYSVNDIYYSIAKMFEVNDPPRYEVPSKFWDSYPRLFDGIYSLNLNRLEKEVLKYSLGDTTKPKKILGWRTTTNLNEGIKNCVEYALQFE